MTDRDAATAAPGHVWVDGRAPAGRRSAPVGVRSRVPARRRRLRDAPRARRPPDRAGRAPRPAPALRRRARHRRSRTTSTTRSRPGIAALLAAEGLDGPDGDASVRITVSRGAVPRPRRPAAGRGRRCRRSSSRPGRSSRRPPATSSAACTSSPRPSGATRTSPLATLKTTSRAEYVYARLEARRAGADDALFLTIDGHLSEGTTANLFLVRPRPDDGPPELATPSLDCAILPGTTRSWLLGWARDASGCAPVEARLTPRRPGRGRRGVPVARAWPGSCRSRVRRRADRRRTARAVDAPRAGRPRGDDRAASGPAVTRDELIARTRQLIDEGDRLQADPSLGVAPGLAPALGRPAGDRVGQHGPLPPRVADGRQAEGHRPRPADDAGRGGGLRPRGRRAEDRGAADEPRRGRAPGHAVRRRDRRRRAAARVPPDRRRRVRPARSPDRAARSRRPADRPGLAERLAEARRRADAHLDHDAPRAPRPDRMQR